LSDGAASQDILSGSALFWVKSMC